MTITDEKLRAKYDHLCGRLADYRRVLVAFSGGVDSTLLLKAALDAVGPENALAVIGVSGLMPHRALAEARQLTQALQAELLEIQLDELADEAFRRNDAQRCYHCRQHLFPRLQQVAQERDLAAVVCGANVDDSADYRPGAKAAAEFHIACPLRDAGLTKDEIRTLSRHLNLPTWDKPADPCLATRLAYGLTITPQRLEQVQHGEDYLRDLGLTGSLRVRHHDNLARIEVNAADIARLTEPNQRTELLQFFKNLGFTYVTLDLQGFRTGSGNEALPKNVARTSRS